MLLFQRTEMEVELAKRYLKNGYAISTFTQLSNAKNDSEIAMEKTCTKYSTHVNALIRTHKRSTITHNLRKRTLAHAHSLIPIVVLSIIILRLFLAISSLVAHQLAFFPVLCSMSLFCFFMVHGNN